MFMQNKHIAGVSLAALAALVLFTRPVQATQPVGFTSQQFRGLISSNVDTNQWDPGPLFTLLIQSSSDAWGYDVVQGTATLAPADAAGNPSQTGWHSHPTAISIALVVQGTLWIQEKENPNCLTPYPAGTVVVERPGHIHNGYNLDRNGPVVFSFTHFVGRSVPATKQDQPDPVTGNPDTASPPPPACAASPSGTTGSPQ
jgi:hypothetical protein